VVVISLRRVLSHDGARRLTSFRFPQLHSAEGRKGCQKLSHRRKERKCEVRSKVISCGISPRCLDQPETAGHRQANGSDRLIILLDFAENSRLASRNQDAKKRMTKGRYELLQSKPRQTNLRPGRNVGQACGVSPTSVIPPSQAGLRRLDILSTCSSNLFHAA
jgi:hypothetical protein